ncbi:MAG: CPBP family glutamic-type intramembrane protease [Novosphingobium sp.]
MNASLARNPFAALCLPKVWRDFGAFVLRPRWMEPAGLRAKGAWRVLALMLALHLAVMAALMPVLSLWQGSMGLSGPDAFGQVPQVWLAPIVVLLAPVLEECVFRGWLNGRPRALWLLAVLAAASAGIAMAQPSPWPTVAVFFGGLLAAPIGWLVLRKRRTPQVWRARWFALPFYAGALLFGLMHLMNYPQPGLLMLPMVLPQLWAAFTLGYLRMRIGLTASILAHATSNALALGLAMAGG